MDNKIDLVGSIHVSLGSTINVNYALVKPLCPNKYTGLSCTKMKSRIIHSCPKDRLLMLPSVT